MGDKASKPNQGEEYRNGEVGFDDFKVLRAIGRGAFGKVCIVKRKHTDNVYAMKYTSKLESWKSGAIENILKELHILTKLHHPFLVNLWFTFQDEEDIFMISDLLLGGDLGFHIKKNVQFSFEDARVYLYEMASVLDYLKSKCIVHRDIKPDNLLLDEKGHIHLTDFNVAAVVTNSNDQLKSFAGTKPYTAPQVYQSYLGTGNGYSYAADWWSLGVTMYEVLRRKRPFNIDAHMSDKEVLNLLRDGQVSFPTNWPNMLKDLLFELLEFDADKRLCNFSSLSKHTFCQTACLDDVISYKLQPDFQPSQTCLNYDPTHELEEMIVESNPLHKKKQRIQKRQRERERSLKRSLKQQKSNDSITVNETPETPEEKALKKIEEKFVAFNRERMNTPEPTVNRTDETNNAPDVLESDVTRTKRWAEAGNIREIEENSVFHEKTDVAELTT